MKTSYKWLSATLLSVSIFQMAMVGLAPILSALGTAFPDAAPLAVQMAGSFLCLIMVLFALAANRISAAIGRRNMMLTAMVLLIIASLGGWLIHGSLLMVYIWSSLIGAAVGLAVPSVFSLIMDMYSGDAQTTVTSLQSIVVGAGGVALSFLTGALATNHWNNAFLAFLLAIPPLFLVLFNVPTEQQVLQALPADKKPVSETSQASWGSIPGYVWLSALQTFLFAVLYFAFSTNISLYMAERAYTSTALMGAITSVFMFGTCVSSALLKPALKTFGRYIPAASFLLLALSYLGLCATGNLVIIILTAFVGGSTLGFIFPYFVVSVGSRIDAARSILASSLVISVAPNFGSFISPILLTPLTKLVGGETVGARFLLAAVAAIVLGIVLIIIQKRKKSP